MTSLHFHSVWYTLYYMNAYMHMYLEQKRQEENVNHSVDHGRCENSLALLHTQRSTTELLVHLWLYAHALYSCHRYTVYMTLNTCTCTYTIVSAICTVCTVSVYIWVCIYDFMSVYIWLYTHAHTLVSAVWLYTHACTYACQRYMHGKCTCVVYV